jgi:hypothetical protein
MILTKHWLRLWNDGPGVSWRPASAPMLFSERHGHARTFVLFGVRFRLLARIDGPRKQAGGSRG